MHEMKIVYSIELQRLKNRSVESLAELQQFKNEMSRVWANSNGLKMKCRESGRKLQNTKKVYPRHYRRKNRLAIAVNERSE